MINLRKPIVAIVLFIVVVIYLITAYFSTGFHNADEHFQLIEFAQYKLGYSNVQDLAWEYGAKIRPGLQPLVCYVVFSILSVFHINDPYVLAFVLRAITALLAVGIIFKFFTSTVNNVPTHYHLIYFILSYTLWFLPYINVRFSSETWSGLFFLWAIAITHNGFADKARNYYLLGVVLGISVLFRCQLVLCAVGLGLWLLLIVHERLRNLLKTTLAFVIIMVAGIMVDWWLYGEFTLSIYNYFHANIVEDVASRFGVSPWYEYIIYVVREPGPFGIFIFFSFLILVLKAPKNILIWVIAPYIIVHSIIPHKEVRFLFPLANFVPLILIQGFLLVPSPNVSGLKFTKSIVLVILGLVNIAGLICVGTKGAGNTKMTITSIIHRHWSDERVNLLFIKGSNPYADSVFPRNMFYRNDSVGLTELVTVWQYNFQHLRKSGQTNLLVMPQSEITGPKTIARISELGLRKVCESIPWFDRFVIKFYKRSLLADNLILFEFSEGQ